MAAKNEKTVNPTPPPAGRPMTGIATPAQVADVQAAAALALSDKQKKEQAVRAQEDAITAAAKQFEAQLAEVSSAKPEDFEEGEKDFWRPSETERAVQGIFIGTSTPGRYKQHAVLVKGKDGKALPLRFLGTHKLTRELARCMPGDKVRIEYIGDVSVEVGKMKDFKVSVLKRA